jgi:hypothetical protein
MASHDWPLQNTHECIVGWPLVVAALLALWGVVQAINIVSIGEIPP